MKHSHQALKAFSFSCLLMLSGTVFAVPMPSINFWGTIDSGYVYDRPIPDETLQPEWIDISGLTFTGSLIYKYEFLDTSEYDMIMNIDGYTFNAIGGSFYRIPYLDEKISIIGPNDRPIYILKSTGYNMTSTLDANFNPNGTGFMSGAIGDLSIVGIYNFEANVNYQFIPEPSIIFLMGLGIVILLLTNRYSIANKLMFRHTARNVEKFAS